MISISDELSNLLYSNYIPKCEANVSIKRATYYNNNYTDYEVVSIGSSDMINLKIAQKTDVFGREVPSITATWEQYAIRDNMGIVNQDIKNTVYRKMAVDISFVYFVGGENSWNNIFNDYSSWKEVLSNNGSWNDLMFGERKEEVKMRRLFLTNPPTLSGDKWQWEARDLLYFLEKESTIFGGFDSPILSQNLRTGVAQQVFLFNEKVRRESYIFDEAIDASRTLTYGTSRDWNNLTKPQVISGITKNILKDMFSCVNRYLSFDEDSGGISLKAVSETVSKEPTRFISLENIKKFPEKEQSLSISNYSFGFSEPNIDRKNAYSLTVNGLRSSVFFPEYESTYRYNFEDAGTPYNEDGSITLTPSQDMFQKEARISEKSATFYIRNSMVVDSDTGNVIVPVVSLTVYPIRTATATDVFEGGNEETGDNYSEFSESNPLNVYTKSDSFAINRNDLLRSYFNKENSVYTMETFGDVSIEIEDIVSFQSNEYGGEGYKVSKGIVVENEITYNGAIKQKLVIHELYEGV